VESAQLSGLDSALGPILGWSWGWSWGWAFSWSLLLCVGAVSAAPNANCHIHPPATTGAEAPNADTAPAIVGPFQGHSACEQARSALFGALGRCHCSATFTPGWVGQQPGRDVGDSAGGPPSAVLP
jgi:hypothetical protein